MKRLALAAAFIVSGLLNACASVVPVVDFYDVDSASLGRFQTIEVVDRTTAKAGNYRGLGTVEGIYCDRSYGGVDLAGPFANAHVMDQVKLKAAKLGADFISTPECLIRTKGDVANNCTATVTCKSLALKFVGEPLASSYGGV